jgi:signal transduction histidine kinase
VRRLHLSTLLLAANAALVTLAVAGVALAASGLLGRLAREQALARAALAGSAAGEAVERSAGDVRTSALLLSERPTVARLAGAGRREELAAFLERFRRTSHLSGCAILAGGRPLAETSAAPATSAAGGPLPWTDLFAAAGRRPGEAALVRPAGGPPLLVAVAPIPALPRHAAAAALALDGSFLHDIAQQVGLPVAVLTAEEVAAEPEGPRDELRRRALDSGRPATGRDNRDGRGGPFVAAVPLNLGGRAAAVVETALPAVAVAPSLAATERTLLWASLATAALATLSGLLVGRRMARPVEALTAAAARIGRGDLATPLLPGPEAAPGAEIGSLASTMEEMRRRLLALTAELKRRQAEAEAVLSGIAEGVFAVDGERRIRYLNPQAAAMLGIEPAAALGAFCGDVLHPEGPDGVRPCDEACPIVHARFRGGARATEHLRTAAGTLRTMVVTSSPPAEGRQFQVLRDETETEAVRRLRDAVLANLSHEFRTPLAAQLAALELLRDKLPALAGSGVDNPPALAGSDENNAPALAGGEAAELVGSLERGTLRLTQLVDNLLESVRIEAGEHGIRRRPVALDEVVEEAVELTSPLLVQRAQRVAVELPYPLPAVLGDAPRLTQVFVNLLANANKYAPGDSVIRIGGAVAERTVSLWVEDQGPGLPEDGGGELFERFVRAPARSADGEPEQTGMGLGLWIVKSIIERHGGSIEATASESGAGARVRVTLPRQEAA